MNLSEVGEVGLIAFRATVPQTVVSAHDPNSVMHMLENDMLVMAYDLVGENWQSDFWQAIRAATERGDLAMLGTEVLTTGPDIGVFTQIEEFRKRMNSKLAG